MHVIYYTYYIVLYILYYIIRTPTITIIPSFIQRAGATEGGAVPEPRLLLQGIPGMRLHRARTQGSVLCSSSVVVCSTVVVYIVVVENYMVV